MKMFQLKITLMAGVFFILVSCQNTSNQTYDISMPSESEVLTSTIPVKIGHIAADSVVDAPMQSDLEFSVTSDVTPKDDVSKVAERMFKKDIFTWYYHKNYNNGYLLFREDDVVGLYSILDSKTFLLDFDKENFSDVYYVDDTYIYAVDTTTFVEENTLIFLKHDYTQKTSEYMTIKISSTPYDIDHFTYFNEYTCFMISGYNGNDGIIIVSADGKYAFHKMDSISLYRDTLQNIGERIYLCNAEIWYEVRITDLNTYNLLSTDSLFEVDPTSIKIDDNFKLVNEQNVTLISGKSQFVLGDSHASLIDVLIDENKNKYIIIVDSEESIVYKLK